MLFFLILQSCCHITSYILIAIYVEIIRKTAYNYRKSLTVQAIISAKIGLPLLLAGKSSFLEF